MQESLNFYNKKHPILVAKFTHLYTPIYQQLTEGIKFPRERIKIFREEIKIISQ